MYKENYGNIPNKDKINYYLIEDNQNIGAWVRRSKIIGKTAKMMAKELGLDKDIAFACGSLFEIGKKENKNNLEKNIRGFYILRKESYFFPAKTNLSHSFIIKDIDSYVGEDNLEEKYKKMIKNFLLSYTYTDYDKLIQVLDNSITDKYIGIEKYQKYLKEKYKKIPYEKERLKILESYQKYFENKLKNPIEYYVNKNIKKWNDSKQIRFERVVFCLYKPPQLDWGVSIALAMITKQKYLSDIINLRSANCKIKKVNEVLNDTHSLSHTKWSCKYYHDRDQWNGSLLGI